MVSNIFIYIYINDIIHICFFLMFIPIWGYMIHFVQSFSNGLGGFSNHQLEALSSVWVTFGVPTWSRTNISALRWEPAMIRFDASEIRINSPVDMVNIPLCTGFFLHPRWLFGISEPSRVWRITYRQVAEVAILDWHLCYWHWCFFWLHSYIIYIISILRICPCHPPRTHTYLNTRIISDQDMFAFLLALCVRVTPWH